MCVCVCVGVVPRSSGRITGKRYSELEAAARNSEKGGWSSKRDCLHMGKSIGTEKKTNRNEGLPAEGRWSKTDFPLYDFGLITYFRV